MTERQQRHARGQRLRAHRATRGWSQERLALAAGLSSGNIVHLLERGRVGGEVATWLRLAAALEVPPLALLGVADPAGTR